MPLHEPLKGPIQLLCNEIEFSFHPRMETPEMLVAFVSGLLDEIDEMRGIKAVLADRVGAEGPSGASGLVLGYARGMVAVSTVEGLVKAAAGVHDLCHEHNPEDAYPTDHLIDLVSSCASAIRFGLETPCRSRHAATAADHVWEQRYGIRLFDNITPHWRKDWTRRKLSEAIGSLLPASTMKLLERAGGKAE